MDTRSRHASIPAKGSKRPRQWSVYCLTYHDTGYRDLPMTQQPHTTVQRQRQNSYVLRSCSMAEGGDPAQRLLVIPRHRNPRTHRDELTHTLHSHTDPAGSAMRFQVQSPPFPLECSFSQLYFCQNTFSLLYTKAL